MGQTAAGAKKAAMTRRKNAALRKLRDNARLGKRTKPTPMKATLLAVQQQSAKKPGIETLLSDDLSGGSFSPERHEPSSTEIFTMRNYRKASAKDNLAWAWDKVRVAATTTIGAESCSISRQDYDVLTYLTNEALGRS